MSTKPSPKRSTLAAAATLLGLCAHGCPVTDPEPIAGNGGTETSGAGGDPQGGTTGASTSTGGESGFVGGSIGGGPSQGIDDGSSGITGRAGDGPSGSSGN